MESKWTGSVLGLIGTSIVASLITSITFGIGAPWAICYVIKYFVEHATISGQRITFDGTGGQLFGNYIKWFLLTIITFGIYGLWLPNNICKWVAKHLKAAD